MKPSERIIERWREKYPDVPMTTGDLPWQILRYLDELDEKRKGAPEPERNVSPNLLVRELRTIRVERCSITVQLVVESDPSIVGNVVTLRMTGPLAEDIGVALERAGSTESDMRLKP